MLKDYLIKHSCGYEDGHFLLQDNQTYYLWLPSLEEEKLLGIQRFIKKLDDLEEIYALNFGNCLGDFQIEDLKIRVVSRKLTRAQFYSLLSEVGDFFAGLPFSYRGGQGGFKKIGEYSNPVLYHVFCWLLSLMDKGIIKEAVQTVIYNPHITYFKEGKMYQVERARRVSPKTFSVMLREPRELVKPPVSSRIHDTALSYHLGRYFPENVYLETLQGTIDNRENAFIKYFLGYCLGIATKFIEKFNDDLVLCKKAKVLEKSLEKILKMPFFLGISQLREIPFSSQVLQKRRGYGEIFTIFNQLNSLIEFSPEKDWEEVIEIKDAATLYEYWVFINVAEIMEKNLGKARKAQWVKQKEMLEVGLASALEIDFPHGFKLKYNKSFWRYGGGSYSVTLRPDVVLEIGNKKFVFDAKFKLDKIEMGNLLSIEEESNGEETTFKKEDVHKMHTYKDAIQGCVGAFIVYPGKETEIFQEKKGSKIWDCGGVGAIGCAPSGEKDELEKIINEIIEKNI